MTWPLIIHPEAQLDIEEAAFHYETQRPGLADRFLSELDRLLQRIGNNPHQFPLVGRDVRRGLLHRFPYNVYFTSTDEGIVVIACLHQHRHPDAWKHRT
ncbi:MAG: type II toxin-antitoxin system RelE/ParE family toxin [Thermodesulfobacteriota bacterium]